MRKEVFILGAGASKAAGNLPLGSELVWKNFMDSFPRVPSYYHDLKHIILDLYPELEKQFSYIENDYKDNVIPSEGFLEKRYYIDVILQQTTNSKAISIIRKAIYEHLVQSNNAIQYESRYCNDRENLLFYKFCLYLKYLQKDGVDITIISFNFDSLLHEEKELNLYFDYLLSFDLTHPGRNYKRGDSIPLIKLNGSADWWFCNNCEYLYLPHWFLFHDSPYKESHNCDNGKWEPLIVLPHESRNLKILETLENKAEEALSQADKITVIGYSFPQYEDKRISNLMTNSINELATFLIVDKGQLNKSRIEQSLRRILPHTKTLAKFNLKGFETYINDKMQELVL